MSNAKRKLLFYFLFIYLFIFGHRQSAGAVRTFAVKVALSHMCAGKLVDKLHCKQINRTMLKLKRRKKI
jgi:hypothetical protein